jgi:NADPH:quinone reductase-like Zn-dependent oxidoreductase
MADSKLAFWAMQTQSDDFSGLEFKQGLPYHELQVGDEDVLVELHAASLNYRELVIVKVRGRSELHRMNANSHQGKLGKVVPPGTVPGSDGAGVVLNVGSKVSSLKMGDRVVTHMLPRTFKNQSLAPIEDDSFPNMAYIDEGIGQGISGTLATHAAFPESCLVKIDNDLSFAEAATLTCSGITAWNALNGLESKKVKKGDWVLTQGTGGVSIAALQV